jgi:PAS domain S-box-containing protein
MKAELPIDEVLRLKALHDLAILDSPREQSFDDVALVAMHVCDVPIAVISLIDKDRQWFKSCLGLDATESSRDLAFCAHAILSPDTVLVVEDATKDARFFDNDLVTGEPYIRFYAGAPLVTASGMALGTLCVLDYKPRRLSREQLDVLEVLSRQVIQLLRLRSAHDVIQQKEKLLSSLLKNFPGAAYRCENNEKWTMLYLSDAVEQLTGYPARSFLNNNELSFKKLMHPSDVIRINEVCDQAIRDKTSFEIEYSLKRADGNWRYVYEIGCGVFDQEGHLEFIDGFIWDIQARIDDEYEKRAMANKLAQLFEMAPIGILQVRDDGRIVASNPEVTRILGYSEAELNGISFLDITPEEDWWKSNLAIENITTTGRFGPLEKTYLHKNGEHIPVELSGSLINIHEGQGQIWWTLVKDIREQKRIDRMKSEFISTVSHELRTPLTSISGALGLITSNALGALPDKVKSMLDIAYKNSQRLSYLIDDLLDMEKLIAGKMFFDMSEHAVLPLVQQAMAENRSYADKYSVQFVVEDFAPNTNIYIDAFRFQQILNNFLSNAAKYSPAQGRVDVRIEESGGWVRISVSDYGQGIPEEFKVRMFQKFSQADSSNTREKGGTGLGLAISKELVERMGGIIGFDSEQGRGTCFYAKFKSCSHGAVDKLSEEKSV